jgi:lipopolysaccharide/colanic/teichoic acid biosynthesis glycosyltransferase
MIHTSATATEPHGHVPPADEARDVPTIWGLTPMQVHDRFWASRGVQVVRQGEQSEIVDDAEIFLLIDPRSMVIFKLTDPVEQLTWLQPKLLYVRLHDKRQRGYREKVVTDSHGRFKRFERIYGGSDPQLTRAAMTTDRKVALLWQLAESPRAGWRMLRQKVDAAQRATTSLPGRVFAADRDEEVMEGLHAIVQLWRRPDTTIPRARRHSSQVWSDQAAQLGEDLNFVGSAWIGTGRQIPTHSSVVGPAVLWDDPAHRPRTEKVRWQELEPIPVLDRPVRPRELTSHARALKRGFDLAFAIVGLLLTLPLYPLIMLLILLDDGWPIFFAHERETMGGREFPCYKFRSMRRDADQIKQQLMGQNQADGPQFFIDDDPRLTRVGRFMRRLQLDELPQLFNILMGHMSVVGPRPSPFKENQYCPPWREARLSVRPGLTGLWQVKRTRESGLDFQEWIRYDIEYVENVSFRLDLWIIWKTILYVIKGSK